MEKETQEMLAAILDGINGMEKRFTEKLDSINNNINQLTETIEDVRLDTDIIKAIVQKQSSDINKLKLVK